MSTRKRYKLKSYGSLFWTRASFACQSSDLIVKTRLLVDTGASYTVLSDRLMRSITQTEVIRQQSIMTASDVIQAPVLNVPWINCLGKRVLEFPIVSLSMPRTAFIDGLLGIDFLRVCGAVIDVDRAEILITR